MATGHATLPPTPFGWYAGEGRQRQVFNAIGAMVGGGTAAVRHRGQNADFTYVAAAGQRVTLRVISSSWTSDAGPGAAALRRYDPTGVNRGAVELRQQPVLGQFDLNLAGTWLIRLDPRGASMGNVTFSASADSPSGTLVRIASDIMRGTPQPGWRGGQVPRVFGAGHYAVPGPSLGSCLWWPRTAPTRCDTDQHVGLDSDGYTRWVYSLAYGADVLGSGDPRAQQTKLRPVVAPIAGDVVAIGAYRATGYPTQYTTIYLGEGKAVAPFAPGTGVRFVHVADLGVPVTYWRL